MLDDDVRIRPVLPEEAEDLSDIAWRSKGYWEYSAEMMSEFRDFLTLSEEFLENNPCYLAENEETDEKLGFYCLEMRDDGRWWLRHLWVVPEYIGTGIGGELFLHACEMAETVGAEELYILSDPNGEEFYHHMGAEKIGMETLDIGQIKRTLPVLCIKL
ncbi:MAG: GNAT family N-acetyltransferase [Synergistaceae bacterium]|nr:GNAT family N-acetyltransferase [Synergistaceae bacterium]